MSQSAASQYQTQQIMTASPAMLVFMLFEKAIGCLKEAIKAIEDNEIEARWRANGRAMEIISHLQLTLDTDKGGEIAANLDRLYSYMLTRLPKVDIRNDSQAAREVIGLLEPLRESWRELAKQGDQPQKEAARITAELARNAPAAVPVAAPAPQPSQPVARPATVTGYPPSSGQRPRSVDEPKRVMISA
jgi:flagellar protein FliS